MVGTTRAHGGRAATGCLAGREAGAAVAWDDMSIAFGGMVAFLFRGLNLAVALATVLLTSHQLSKDEYGVFVLGLTVIGVVNALTGGLTAAVAYQVSNQKRAPGEALASGSILSGGIGVLGIAAGIVGMLVLAGDAGAVALPVALAGAAVVLNSIVAGTFLGRESLVRYNIALVAPPLLSLAVVAAVFVAFDHRSPEAALGSYAVGQWVALALLLLSGGRRLVAGARFTPGLVRAILSFALLAGISSGVSYLNYRADLFVVRNFEGKDGVATYSLAVYLAESVWQVSGSLALATYARIGGLARREAAALTARVMRHTIVMLTVVCGLLFAVAPLIESVAFSKYDGMATALRFILPGILVYGLAQSFSGFYTYQRGLPWVSAIVAGSGLVLDIALALILVPRMGVNGAALASAIAYSAAMLGALLFFLRGEHLHPAEVFRFGRADVADYQSLLRRLRAGLAR